MLLLCVFVFTSWDQLFSDPLRFFHRWRELWPEIDIQTGRRVEHQSNNSRKNTTVITFYDQFIWWSRCISLETHQIPLSISTVRSSIVSIYICTLNGLQRETHTWNENENIFRERDNFKVEIDFISMPSDDDFFSAIPLFCCCFLCLLNMSHCSRFAQRQQRSSGRTNGCEKKTTNWFTFAT